MKKHHVSSRFNKEGWHSPSYTKLKQQESTTFHAF